MVFYSTYHNRLQQHARKDSLKFYCNVAGILYTDLILHVNGCRQILRRHRIQYHAKNIHISDFRAVVERSFAALNRRNNEQ